MSLLGQKARSFDGKSERCHGAETARTLPICASYSARGRGDQRRPLGLTAAGVHHKRGNRHRSAIGRSQYTDVVGCRSDAFPGGTRAGNVRVRRMTSSRNLLDCGDSSAPDASAYKKETMPTEVAESRSSAR
jgi:hypothetical protein